METNSSVGDNPEFVALQINDKIRSAAGRAAIAASTSIDELLENILIDYLVTSGYLCDPVDIKQSLSSYKGN